MGLTIHPLSLGEGEVDSSFAVWQLTPGTKVKVPLTGYLILGGTEPVLVDTGVGDPAALSASVGIPFTRSAEQTLSAALAKHGISVEDIGLVIMTHLHADHTGQLGVLPRARFAVQRSELQYAAAPLFPTPLFDRHDIGLLTGALFDRIAFLDGDEEIVPGVRGVLTGGHSPGHQMLEVDVDSGLAIITGDLIFLIDPALEAGVPPGYITNLEETLRGIARIRRTADHVLPMHDRIVYELYPDGVS
jgi:N-acyl homoserine lactone hydrolase